MSCSRTTPPRFHFRNEWFFSSFNLMLARSFQAKVVHLLHSAVFLNRQFEEPHPFAMKTQTVFTVS